MKKHHTWAVIVALMSIGKVDSYEHYEIISNAVLKSKLTTLGEKGSTPQQSVGTLLRNKKDIFESKGEGYYELINKEEVENLPAVLNAIEDLQCMPQENLTILKLKEELKAQQKTIDKLEEIIRTLKETIIKNGF